MIWKQYISHLQSVESTSKYSFNYPVPYFLLQDIQRQFGLRELPGELLELYKETNGVEENLDGDKIGELIWTVDRVIKTNSEFRSDPEYRRLYMSFDQFLFISDAGNGDLFGFVTLDGGLTETIFLFGITRMTVEPG